MKQPTHKACRRYGVKLCQSEKCPVTKRNYPPGMHGPKGPRRLTEYGKQLAEKQKAKIVYGIQEKQFRNYFDKALNKVGNTADILFGLLENRLDNAVYRLGLASTRSQARQWIGHGHFQVNGKKVNIPSYLLKVGDEVAIRERSQKSLFKDLPEKLQNKETPTWLNLDKKELKGKITGQPKLAEGGAIIDWRMIIEYYSKK